MTSRGILETHKSESPNCQHSSSEQLSWAKIEIASERLSKMIASSSYAFHIGCIEAPLSVMKPDEDFKTSSKCKAGSSEQACIRATSHTSQEPVTKKLWEPKIPSKSCSVVTDAQVYSSVKSCDRALNQMLFQWISIHFYSCRFSHMII